MRKLMKASNYSVLCKFTMNNKLILFAITGILIILGLLIMLRQNKIIDMSRSLSSGQSADTKQTFETNEKNSPTDNNSFIENLRQREFTGGKITIEKTITSNNIFTSYIFSYPSDNLKIYGMVNIPAGKGPFPVIILNHGYYNPSSFNSGDGTKSIADILATKGYLTLASDYRGHGQSENDTQGRRGGHRPEYAIDILNLIASVNSISQADQNRIGMWGHSMGGEVALRTVEATDKIKALVLWAPTATRGSDNRGFAAGRHMQGVNATPDSSQDGAAPMNYLRYINTPISLHQGLSDTEVNPEGSKELNEALQKEKKQIEYFEYEGQDHNFQTLGWDVISSRTVSFFDKYLK